LCRFGVDPALGIVATIDVSTYEFLKTHMKSFTLNAPWITYIDNEMLGTLRPDSANFRQQFFSLRSCRSTTITGTRSQLGVPP